MDTSREYIKMCDCSEIQGKWEIEIGDFAFHRKDLDVYIVDIDIMVNCNQTSGDTWLPRQDQIQEMMGWDIIKAMNFFYDFYHEEMIEQIGIGNQPKENPKFNTMEQLWLAFYMREKHKLVWTKDKWIKNTN